MSLEKEFGIPEGHTLKQVKSSAKGSMAQDEEWEYEEYDTEGNLVGRYREWSYTNLKTLKTDSGWQKLPLE